MTTKYTKNFGLALPDFRQGPWHDLVNNDFVKLDDLIFGAISQSNVNVWQNSTVYGVGLSVLDETDASIWMCSVGHTSPATGTFAAYRTANPTHWVRLLTGFAPRGEWAQNTQYFPYDLTYDSARGIMALGQTKHISTATGSILTDEAYWAFLLDMSGVSTVVASAVSYSNTSSPTIPATNVQGAIDKLEDFTTALNGVNVTQGNRLDGIDDALAAHDTSIADLGTSKLNLSGNQTTTGGFRHTSYNAGNPTGTFTPNAYNGNYQYLNNANAFTIAVPSFDCAIDLLIANVPGAGAITFSGYTVAPNSGDPFTTTNGHKFVVSIRRINGTSTHFVKALQ